MENIVVTESAAGVRCASLKKILELRRPSTVSGDAHGEDRRPSLICLNGRNLSSGRRGSLRLCAVDSPKNNRRGSVDQRSPAGGRKSRDGHHHQKAQRRSSIRRRKSCHDTAFVPAAELIGLGSEIEEMEAVGLKADSPQGEIYQSIFNDQ